VTVILGTNETRPRTQFKWETSQLKEEGDRFSHIHRSCDKEIDGQRGLISVPAAILHLPAHYSWEQDLQQDTSNLHCYFVTGDHA
jgi:hypothetical protein